MIPFDLFTNTPRPPVVLAEVLGPGQKRVRTEHRPPTPEDFQAHLEGRVALGVLLDLAITLDFDLHTPDQLDLILQTLRSLGIPAYYGPGTTRGSRLWFFRQETGGGEDLARALAGLAKALGLYPVEGYPRGGKPVIIPLFGVLDGNPRPLYDLQGRPVPLPFEPQRVHEEVLRRLVRAGELLRPALSQRPPSRHEALLAFMNLAHRAGVLEEASVLFSHEALWRAWGMEEDGSRTLEAWRDEVDRAAQAAQSLEYERKRGLTYLREAGFSLPETLVRELGEWPEPLLLYRPPEEATPFPLEHLGPLEGVVKRAVAVYQAPEPLVAASFLAVAALGAQGIGVLHVDGRPYPASLFFLTVAPSGERKSELDRVAALPVREVERELQREAREEEVAWRAALEAWEAERRRILSEKKISREEREERLRDLGPRPPSPWTGLMLAADTTIEALLNLLEHDWPSAGLFSSEAGVFLGGYSMSKDHRLYTISTLSRLWDGREVERSRQGEGRRLILGRRLSAHLMSQPEVVQVLLKDRVVRDQGLLARFLLAWPPSRVGGRRYVAEDITAAPEYRAYRERIVALLDCTARNLKSREDGKLEGLEMRTLSLTPQAKELYVAFYEHVEAQMGELTSVRAFAAKAPEHALRLALVLALYEDPEAREVSQEHVERGIALAEFYLQEQKRVLEAAVVPRHLQVAEELLEWIGRRVQGREPKAVYLREILREGPYALRTAEHARRALKTLEEHGYLVRREDLVVDGSRRREVWEVNPHAL